MKITKENGNITFEFPFEKERSNPYMEGEFVGMYPTFTGLIVPQKNCSDPEMGFAYTIDMDYKDKGDQWTDIVVHWHGDKKDFIKECERLGIELFEYEQCARCKGAIYGTATLSKEIHDKWGGAVCSITCEN